MFASFKKIRIKYSFVRFISITDNQKIAEIPSVIKAKDLARILDIKVEKVFIYYYFYYYF